MRQGHVTRRIEENSNADAGKTKTSNNAGQCSELVLYDDLGGTRTHDSLLKRQVLYQLSYEVITSSLYAFLGEIQDGNAVISRNFTSSKTSHALIKTHSEVSGL